ncbi:peptidoglycan endopeptidase [Coralloluteibacterium thermophilus]|uniref:Peptidoglycan endopeptidase n=1 Tax=Coralloluteibacterium thermophilum TaxID=2707049 RepID=A0ABV9NL67_9GAMM
MHLSDVERYVGIPYDKDAADCADLVVLVQRELFGREVRLPQARSRGARGSAQLARVHTEYARRTDTPTDGDLVLMYEDGRLGHAGVYFWLAHEGWVLHSNERSGCSVLHRVRELADFGAPVEGIYAWV